MHYARYDYQADDELHFYEFFSEGLARRIRKIVEYAPTSQPDVYNLAFGDWDEATDSINDGAIANNGDSQKVLATVVSTL